MTVIESIKRELQYIGLDRSSAITYAVALVLFNSGAYRINGNRVEITKAEAAQAAYWVANEASRIVAKLKEGA